MKKLISTIKTVMHDNREFPFSVYSSIKEQHILNVPMVNPMLIVVLSGTKEIGNNNELTCKAGDLVFLSDSPSINLRNIPSNEEYFALLITFDRKDLEGLSVHSSAKKYYRVGKANDALVECLQQFVESATWAPERLWSLRKKEIIELLCHLGHEEILAMVGHSSVSYKLHDMLIKHTHASNHELPMKNICDELAMSESTLRRKLKSEGTSLQTIKDQTRLGLGLHLLQTTRYSIGLIAEKCGYQSQSRFTDRFKKRFGLTPSDLRKTKMTD